MLLIDALYINSGGGKVLLDYLIEELENTSLNIVYLLDKRIEHNHPTIQNSNTIIYEKASLLKRHKFYRNYHSKFSVVLCFGNLPPNQKINAKVYTYFHQPLFLEIPKDIGFMTKVKLSLKTYILNRFKNNTDQFWVQSEYIKNKLVKKYSLKIENVQSKPFYPPLKKHKNLNREKNSFLYVSSGTPHKNQERLINAFSIFYKKNKIGKLTLTVSDQFPEIIGIINKAQEENIPITNIGHVKRNVLAEYYAKSEFLIFPSLAESFGLGLIEAIEQGCKVIAADLPYTYEVCNPSLTFNPEITEKIIEAFETATIKELNLSEPLIKNNIQEIIKSLSV